MAATTVTTSPIVSIAAPPKKRESKVAAKFADAVDDPAALGALVAQLPKGGDLHMHLSGAATTELLLDFGKDDNDCETTMLAAAAGSACTATTKPLVGATSTLVHQVIGPWSMEGFTTAALADWHHHFFAAFGKFGLISRIHTADMLVDVRRTAANAKVSYLEVMIQLGSGTGGDLGEQYVTTWSTSKSRRHGRRSWPTRASRVRSRGRGRR